MSTLRAFVHGVLNEDQAADGAVRSKPDRLSDSFELRRLVASGSKSRPVTDFFEFYWAHLMTGNRLTHVWSLARVLLFRWPWRVPRALRGLWVVSWAMAGAVAFVATALLREKDSLEASVPVLLTLLSAGFGLAQSVAAQYLGDAARYLSPTPENVGIRQNIRSSGVEIVRRIHASGKYDRVVIVGHSLGSVIGYDIITHLWDEMSVVHGSTDRPSQNELKKMEQLRVSLAGMPADGWQPFLDAQRSLWVEQRVLGNPWLITDFVTLGSPLAHAEILFAEDKNELRKRQADRELPTCPPADDGGKYSYRLSPYLVNGEKRTLRVLHHAAPFAVTRWTNIFVPLKLGILGDWVGGPLRALFGNGIVDVPLSKARFASLPLLSHVYYWRASSRSPSTQAIVRALDLDCRRWLPRLDTPDPTTDVDAPGERV